MIYGVGIDNTEPERIASSIDKVKGFKNRVFTDYEIAFCDGLSRKYESYAARFAAKEAFMKALGTGWSKGIGFKDIEVRSEESKQPYIVLYGKAKDMADEAGIVSAHLSLTHVKSLASAIVILETS